MGRARGGVLLTLPEVVAVRVRKMLQTCKKEHKLRREALKLLCRRAACGYVRVSPLVLAFFVLSPSGKWTARVSEESGRGLEMPTYLW